ncbi:hypothetical protein M432DRAFT_554467 [Thermoascus aurantiacus ATCC 26904]
MVAGGLASSRPSSALAENEDFDVPIINDDEPLVDVVQKLTNYLIRAIPDVPYTFEQMRTSVFGHELRPLITYLSENVHNPNIICALMISKWQFANVNDDDWGLNESRGYACEFVAWQFLTCLSHREVIDFLLQELPSPRKNSVALTEAERGLSGFVPGVGDQYCRAVDERTTLLDKSSSSIYRLFAAKDDNEGRSVRDPRRTASAPAGSYVGEQYSSFYGLNALEIATIAHAKKFLSQKVVQRIIDDIWNGEIVFWDTLSVHSRKKPQIFNKRTSDPYSRLRVPVYRKAFEAAFFVSFLFLYYAVLVERNPTGISLLESLMYTWIAAFAYDELGGITDAGMLFYQMGFWSIWNLAIIGTGVAFVITRELFSLVSLNAYFGSLTKAFLKFMPVVIIVYIGFLTTFTMLARDRLTVTEMSWILVKVFFGLVFICMTNILLISSLISLMSMSLEGVMAHAREEYLFHSNSRRLTHFMPPMNLIPLLCLRPLRLFLSAEALRRVRIILLKVTHLPFVAIIMAYEASRRYVSHRNIQAPPISMSRGSNNVPFSAGQASFPTRSAPLHPAATRTSIQSLVSGKGRVSPGQRPETRGPGAAPAGLDRISLSEVLDEVDRLRLQVDRVAATMAVQQHSQ